MSCRRSGKVRTSKSWTARLRLRDPELAGRLAHLARERVGREALRQRAGRDRERVVVHLDSGLDEPRHRAAAAELTVVGVRREHEHALPGLDHAGSSLRAASRRCERDQAEQAPHHRVLEERVVEEAVHGDRAKRKARGECGAPGSRSARAPKRRRKGNADPSQASSTSPGIPVSATTVTGVECEAAFFGSRPFKPVRSGIGALEVARADAEHRVVGGDL